MSDSESEEDFVSADEGEDDDNKKDACKKQEEKTLVKNVKKVESDEKIESKNEEATNNIKDKTTVIRKSEIIQSESNNEKEKADIKIESLDSDLKRTDVEKNSPPCKNIEKFDQQDVTNQFVETSAHFSGDHEHSELHENALMVDGEINKSTEEVCDNEVNHENILNDNDQESEISEVKSVDVINKDSKDLNDRELKITPELNTGDANVSPADSSSVKSAEKLQEPKEEAKADKESIDFEMEVKNAVEVNKATETSKMEKLIEPSNTEKVAETLNVETALKASDTDKNVETQNAEKIMDISNTKEVEESLKVKGVMETPDAEKVVKTTDDSIVEDVTENESKDNQIVNNQPQISSSGNNTTGQEDWGWDSWADDFISQTANKVSSLLETVEHQLGIPDPKEVAETIRKDEVESQSEEGEKQADKLDNVSDSSAGNQAAGASSWFSSFVPVSTLSNLVQSTGQDLVSGSIDALEFLGKRTVNILSEGDPGLRSKRDQLLGKKSTLSSVLQEAKNKSEQVDCKSSMEKGDNPTNFNNMFEKVQGVAHSEALEMLSKECDVKLERILNAQSDAAKDESIEILTAIKEKMELDVELDESKDVHFKKELYLQSKKLQLKVTCSKLLNTWSKIQEKTNFSETINVHDCYENAVMTLAEFTSRCVEYYRKVADMLLMTDMEAKKLAEERASTLKNITQLYQIEVTSLGNSYANYLAENNKESASRIITDIYLEISNCVSLLHDSHNLLSPILKLSAIK